jgi:hypothetical protein
MIPSGHIPAQDNSEAASLQHAAENVLVQREMECGRSPLASITRASAGRVVRTTGQEKKNPGVRGALQRDAAPVIVAI